MCKRFMFIALTRAGALLAATIVGTSTAWASLIWDGGGADANWSTAGNWDDDVAPTASAGVLHFAGSTQTTPNNDYTGGSYAGIQFDSGASAFTLTGNSITLGSGGIVNASSNAQTINLGMTIGSAINVNATGNVTAGGNLAGSGAITKTGAGTLILNGINSNYSGSVTVNAGGLTLNSTSASGTGAINLTPTSSNFVQLNISNSGADGANFGNALNLAPFNSGNNVSLGQVRLCNYAPTACTFSGPVTITADCSAVVIYANTASNPNGNLTFSGDITGSFSNVVNGSAVWLRGNYTTGSGYITGKVTLDNLDTTAVNDGMLAKTDGGTWYINSTGNSWGTTQISNGVIAIGADDALPTTSSVIFGQANYITTYLRLNGHNQTVASVTSSTATNAGGWVINDGTVTSTLTIDNSTDITFGKSGYAAIGMSSGTGTRNDIALVKSGAGVLNLAGPHYYTGDTTVENGTLSIDTAYLSDTANVSIAGGACLNLGFSGADTIGALYLNGAAASLGTWGAAGSGADFTTSLITGSGMLNVTAVPEPGALALLASGLFGLIAYAWRKRR